VHEFSFERVLCGFKLAAYVMKLLHQLDGVAVGYGHFMRVFVVEVVIARGDVFG